MISSHFTVVKVFKSRRIEEGMLGGCGNGKCFCPLTTLSALSFLSENHPQQLPLFHHLCDPRLLPVLWAVGYR